MKKILLLVLLTITAFANIGTIMVSKGDAQVKRARTMIPVQNGMDIKKGDEIITQKQTRVQVMLNDDTVITIGAESSFSFIDYMFDGSKKSSIKMQANRGFFRSVTGKIGQIAPERFKVKTQLATIGIRGTDFSAQLGDGLASYSCNRGEITLSFSQMQKSITGGNTLILELDGLTIKEITASKKKKKEKINALIAEHNTQISIDVDTLSDITENKVDTPNIKFNCNTP